MRRAFSSIIDNLASDKKIILLTGDLGYKAFEGLEEKMKERFINAGVAEQSMISMAAGLAYKGYKVFCYSIAPFITYRCLEQIRNDVCFHKLPVFIVGNGGGYGYGIMGSTHHVLNDIACMSSLPNMNCHVPSFNEDVELSVKEILKAGTPAYLRLGLGKNNPGIKNTNLESINPILSSSQAEITIIASGPVIHNVLSAIENQEYQSKIDLFSAVKIPFDKLTDAFTSSMNKTKKILIVEEHVSRGGVAEHISLKLMEQNINIHLDKFKALSATYYTNGLYGDQNYHQMQSGLDAGNIQSIIKEWLN